MTREDRQNRRAADGVHITPRSCTTYCNGLGCVPAATPLMFHGAGSRGTPARDHRAGRRAEEAGLRHGIATTHPGSSPSAPGSACAGDLMPATQLSRRARLRQEVLREPYQNALREIRATPKRSPVVPAAKTSQAILEGAIFSGIRALHHPYQADSRLPPTISGWLDIQRLRPTPLHLDVEVGREGASWTLARLIADHFEEPGRGPVAAAGIRMRDNRGAAEFYRPGHSGAVRFRGVPAVEVLAAHREACPDATCIAEKSPRTITLAEQIDTTHPADRALLSVSSAIRRLGAFLELGSTSIDTWEWMLPPTPDGMVIEAWFPSMTTVEQEQILGDLCSRELSPRWSIDPTWPRGKQFAPPYFVINVEGAADIQLRLFQS